MQYFCLTLSNALSPLPQDLSSRRRCRSAWWWTLALW